jgi:hypothetical protein
MNNTKLYKIIISTGVLIISLLPKIDKELYISSTGNIGSLDIVLAIVIIIGLFKQWKHLKEILLVLFFLRLILSLVYLMPKLIAFDFINFRYGWIVEFIVLTIGIFSLIRLRKVDN